MRAKEFIINIPINIKFNGDGEPEIAVNNQTPPEEEQEELATNFIPPLQQKIELMKHAAGKESDVIDQITSDDDEFI